MLHKLASSTVQRSSWPPLQRWQAGFAPHQGNSGAGGRRAAII
jgi:hypothetical protein